jgi:ribonuclease D
VTADWIDSDAAFSDVVAELRDQPEYALDTEFHRERTYWPQLALLQLAWGPGRIVLVDPLAVDIRKLAEILDGPGLAVLHAADQDIEVLERACGTRPSRLFDTQVAAGFLGMSSPSLTSLVQRLLDTTLSKGDRLTDWNRRPLTDSQKRYAASDVAHLLELKEEIVKRLEPVGRLEWAEQESEALLRRPRDAQQPEKAWWRLKDSRGLRGPARGVAQEVTAWRERRAAAIDKPTRTLLPDLAILGIANHRPKTPQALREIRGLEGRHLRGSLAAEVIDAVERGANLTPEQIHMPPMDDVDRRLRPAATLVSAWVAQLARDLKIDATLLATRADLLALLRGEPEARLATGWRAHLVGEPVRRLVDGEVALSFRRGSGDLVLEQRSGKPVTIDLPVPDEDFS